MLPTWIKPQPAALVKTPPEDEAWLHEIKFDGYRMHARSIMAESICSPAPA
jgi:ATP-dependent DNA ligase